MSHDNKKSEIWKTTNLNRSFVNISVISKFEDAKGVIRSRKSKDRQWSKEKAQRDKQ
jgi:hypothetical protein